MAHRPRGKIEKSFAVELLRHLFVCPLKTGAINLKAATENVDLARRRLRLLYADPLQ